MAASFSVRIKEEQRAMIRILWAENLPRAEIHCRILAKYGKSPLPQRSVYEWKTILQIFRINATDEDRLRRSSTSTTEENIE